jgi:hypothetical protein
MTAQCSHRFITRLAWHIGCHSPGLKCHPPHGVRQWVGVSQFLLHVRNRLRTERHEFDYAALSSHVGMPARYLITAALG